MTSKILATAVAALALTSSLTSAAPCKSAKYTLAMKVDGTYVSLNAIDSGSPGTVDLVAERLSVYPGTPIVQSGNGTAGNADLCLDLDSTGGSSLSNQTGYFHLSIPDVGDRYGLALGLSACSGASCVWPHFFVGDDTIDDAARTAALQMFYACNRTIQGAEFVELSWGVMNDNGSSPYGCVPTEVTQNFNLPCSA